MQASRARGQWYGRRALAVLVTAMACAGAPTARAAEPEEVTTEGYVVSLENDEVVVDLAGKRGAAIGDVIELWRPLKLRHPVTQKIVTDRFRIGSLRLTQVRDTLSLARADGKLARPAEPGDVVILRRQRLVEAPSPALAPGKLPRPAPPRVSPTSPYDETELVPQDPDVAAVSEMFDALRNRDVPTRIAAYEDYVRRHPEGRYAAVLWEEAAQLRRLLDLEKKVGSAPTLTQERFEAPKQTLAGLPLSLGVEIAGPAVGAVLHSRHPGEVAYRSTPMRAVGDGYWVGDVPAERLRAPSLQYFIEGVRADGSAVGVVASAEGPYKVNVESIPTATPSVDHVATASLWTDYADYNRMKGNDVVWQTEGYVGMRFQDEGIRALRTGFGVFRGVGGSLEELDELGKGARRVGLTYGYLEGEFAFSDFTALIVRGVIGLRDKGIAGGAQAHLRLGSDLKTNLTVGGEVLGGIGLRGITQLELKTFERIPIVFRTEVTNQPAGSSTSPEDVTPDTPGALPQDTSTERGEVGARAIVQVGYELLPGFVLAGRGSYQGRNIKHAGPGFGGAVTYTW